MRKRVFLQISNVVDRVPTAILMWAALVGGVLSQPVSAEVVRIEVESRVPFADGHRFGRTGSYEKLTGRLFLEVDPAADANRRVVDLSLAPRNSAGRVEFATDFCLLLPADPTKGNRRLIFGVNNRGNKLLLGAFNERGGNDPTTLADAGNGFLMREGYTVLWCGWNGDVRPGNQRMQIDLPIAKQDGQPITGKVYAEICVNRHEYSQPFDWGNTNSYPVVAGMEEQATLTMRADRGQTPVEVPHDEWAFARFENGDAIPDPRHLYVKEGFRPGWLYELVYTARDPRVTGLGFAAVRDVVAFFRHAEEDAIGTKNPMAGMVQYAYIFGISQSGRFIHHFLHDGFNTDEQQRMVFDAALPHVAGAGKGLFNYRFAQTTRHGSQHEDNLYPSDFFPLNTVPQEDPVTGRRGDTFALPRARGHLPKIFFTLTSTEYWCRAASLLHTDVSGTRDAAIDPNVRVYLFAGNQHGVSRSSARGIYQHQINTLNHRPLLRALLVAMDRWVTTGEEPPSSQYPKIADGTLVPLEIWKRSFPRLPEVRLPDAVYTPLRLDSGPRWTTEGIADHVPPQVGAPYRVLVPAVDADGNELGGIRLPSVSVPLASYSGWNLRGASAGAEGHLARWSGSQWPFSVTRDDRQKTGDPRLSIRERYPTRSSYLADVSEAGLKLYQDRLLLAEDVVQILQSAAGMSYWDE